MKKVLVLSLVVVLLAYHTISHMSSASKRRKRRELRELYLKSLTTEEKERLNAAKERHKAEIEAARPARDKARIEELVAAYGVCEKKRIIFELTQKALQELRQRRKDLSEGSSQIINAHSKVEKNASQAIRAVEAARKIESTTKKSVIATAQMQAAKAAANITKTVVAARIAIEEARQARMAPKRARRAAQLARRDATKAAEVITTEENYINLEIAKIREQFTRMGLGAVGSSACKYAIIRFLKSIGTLAARQKLAEFEISAK